MSGTEVPVRAGEVLAGKYRVERVLGAGAMGVVVAATHVYRTVPDAGRVMRRGK